MTALDKIFFFLKFNYIPSKSHVIINQVQVIGPTLHLPSYKKDSTLQSVPVNITYLAAETPNSEARRQLGDFFCTLSFLQD